MADNNFTSDYVFKAYVVNTAAYDAGERENSGAWLYFPPQAGEVAAVMEQIGLADGGTYFMDDYVSRVEGLKPLLPMYGDIDELTAVAQAVAGLSPDDRELLSAVQESPYKLTSLQQFREFPDNIDFFTLSPQVKSLDELGWAYLGEHLDIPLTPALRAAVDPVPFGRQAMAEHQGCLTDRGYLTLSGDEWRHERAERPGEQRAEKKPSIKERLEQSRKECAGQNKAQPRREKSAPEL